MSLLTPSRTTPKSASHDRTLIDGLIGRLHLKAGFVDAGSVPAGGSLLGQPPQAMPPAPGAMGAPPPGAMDPGMGGAPPGAGMPPPPPPGGDPAAAGGAPPPAPGGDPAAGGGDPASFAQTPPPPPDMSGGQGGAGGQPGGSALEAAWSGDPSLNPKIKVDENMMLLIILRLLTFIVDKLGINVPLSLMTVLPPELLALPQEQAAPPGGGGGGAGGITPPAPVDPMTPAMPGGGAAAPAGGQTKTSQEAVTAKRAELVWELLTLLEPMGKIAMFSMAKAAKAKVLSFVGGRTVGPSLSEPAAPPTFATKVAAPRKPTSAREQAAALAYVAGLGLQNSERR